jgi:signal transduction histidine kinase
VTLREEIEGLEVFAGLTPAQLDWIAAHSRERALEAGGILFAEGDPPEELYVVLEGELRARVEHGPSTGLLFMRKSGEVTGMLPHSRMKRIPVTGRAVVPTRVLVLPAADFPEMLRLIPELEPRLVAVMSDRVRETARVDQQREKLMALGKLSAGLAHELNNPAAALRRSVGELRRRLDELQSLGLDLVARGLEPERLRTMTGLRARADRTAAAGLDPLDRSEREEAWEAVLSRHGVAQPWVAAEAIVSAGLAPEAVEETLAGIDPGERGSVLAWLAADLSAHGMLEEAERATDRISGLVAAVKSYSRLDEAPEKRPIDLHEGIDATITVLAPRFRERGITVTRAYAKELPQVSAYPGELNQVWTNLLENAVDAVGKGGRVQVRTVPGQNAVRVEIEDDGPGIPAEILNRIWEPFYTTKDVGKGTGLGLDIVRRIVVQQHGGDVRVDSAPGRTVFEVRLPVG